MMTTKKEMGTPYALLYYPLTSDLEWIPDNKL